MSGNKMANFFGFLGKVEIMWTSLLFMVIGVILISLYFRNKKLEFKSTYGKVTNKQLMQRTKNGNRYTITYVYTVNGKEYEGQNNMTARFNTQQNDNIKVYYNVKKPSESRLSKNPGTMYLYAGIGMMIISGALFYFRNSEYLQWYMAWK